jgi:hypothetical protein
MIRVINIFTSTIYSQGNYGLEVGPRMRAIWHLRRENYDVMDWNFRLAKIVKIIENLMAK